MRQFIILFAVIFAIVWGLGLFFGYLSGIKHVALPDASLGISSTNQIETQRRLSTESRESNEKMMQDYKFQIQGLKNNFKTISP